MESSFLSLRDWIRSVYQNQNRKVRKRLPGERTLPPAGFPVQVKSSLATVQVEVSVFASGPCLAISMDMASAFPSRDRPSIRVQRVLPLGLRCGCPGSQEYRFALHAFPTSVRRFTRSRDSQSAAPDRVSVECTAARHAAVDGASLMIGGDKLACFVMSLPKRERFPDGSILHGRSKR